MAEGTFRIQKLLSMRYLDNLQIFLRACRLALISFACLSFPVWAGLDKGELDGKGLECEVAQKEYERDQIPKYFIFEKGEVFWLVAPNRGSDRVTKLPHGQYFESDDSVRWYPYILDRKTLRLDKLRPSYPSRKHDCRIVNIEKIKAILMQKSE